MNDDIEFTGALSQLAAGQHEMYTSWVNAGFTPEQALELLKVWVSAIVVRRNDG